MPASLPQEYTFHLWRLDDLEEVAALMDACDIADVGMKDHPLEEIRADWAANIADADNRGWLVRDTLEALIAFAYVEHTYHERIYSDIFVHPAVRGQGIEEALLEVVEEHAISVMLPHCVMDKRIALRSSPYSTNQRDLRMLAEHGYTEVRRFLRMDIALPAEPIPAPTVPEGLTLRGFDPERDAHAVHATMQEAFRDHWGSLPRPFEEFSQHHLQRRDFDPSLWFIVMDGAEIAGAIIGSHDSPTVGWVGTLGVRRPWRGRGVGQTLLLACFGAMQRAGKTHVGLGVDATNETGAVRLYERVGMRAIITSVVMEKELRPAVGTLSE